MDPLIRQLKRWYAAAGLPEATWHIGPEHPALEDLAIGLLRDLRLQRVLEIGVQAGGFAIPVIDAFGGAPHFQYTGVDNHAYTNAVPFDLLEDFLARHAHDAAVRLVESDSGTFLGTADAGAYDLILLDHYKPRYPADLLTICRRDLPGEDGIILIHDVLGNARDQWKLCLAVARDYGWTATMHPEIPQGAAVLRRRRDRARAPAARRLATAGVVNARWQAHRIHAGGRLAIGRLLRATGLRRGGP